MQLGSRWANHLPRLQDLANGPKDKGAPGQSLKLNSKGTRLEWTTAATGTTDHGELSGLDDDDHVNYLNNARHDTDARHTLGTVVPHDMHANLAGLDADDHVQYASSEGAGTRRAYEAGRLNKSVIAGDGLAGGGLMTDDRTLQVDVGVGISITGGKVAHDAGDFGDLHTNYTEHDQPEVVTGAWEFNVGPNFSGGIQSSFVPSLPDTYDIGTELRHWRKGWFSELDAVLFAEYTQSVIGGGLIVPHDQGTLAAEVDSTQTQIDFGKAMTLNDFVILRGQDASGNAKVEYLKVGSLVTGTTYNVSRNVDGSGSNTWAQGAVFAVYGNTGDGRIEISAQDGGPRISIVEQGAMYSAQTERVRFGDLSGLSTLSGYGFCVGDPTSSEYMYYTSAGLNVRGTINADDGYLGNLSVSGLLDIASGGGIRVGSGTKDTDLSGWFLDHSEIVGQSNGVDQVVLNSNGQISAGGGRLILGSEYYVKFYDNNSVYRGAIGWKPGIDWTAPTMIMRYAGETYYTDIEVKDERIDLVPGNSSGMRLTVDSELEWRWQSGTFVSSKVVANKDGDMRFAGGLYVGGVGTDPAAGTITATDYIVALGGMHVGGTSDPGTDNLVVDADGRFGGGLVAGSTTIDPSSGEVIYTGNLRPRRGTTTYTGYAYVPYEKNVWAGSSLGNVNSYLTMSDYSVPSSAVAVVVSVQVKYTSAGHYMILGSVSNPASSSWSVGARTKGADWAYSDNDAGIVNTNNGKIYYSCNTVSEVHLRIWGYFI